MRTITGASSAYTARLQADAINIAELVELTTVNKVYRWTTCNATLVSSGNTYDPFPGGSTGIQESSDLSVGNIEFVMARSGDIGTFSNAFAMDMATIRIRRIFTDTPDLGSMTIFHGKLSTFTWDRNTVTGQVQNLFGDMRNDFPPYMYMDNCSWRFGSTGCTFNTSSITVAGSLNVGASTAVTLVTATGFLSNSFAAGALERGRAIITSGANSGQARSIRANSGDAIDLSHTLPFPLEGGGVTLKVYPGCRKRYITDCLSKYNNIQNYLGFPWMPTQELVF